MDADTLAPALRDAHGCPPGCGACRRGDAESHEGDLARFLPLVTGPLALRFARAFDRYGIPIPAEAFTADPLEQWLIREAMMERHRETAEAAEARTHGRLREEQEANELRLAARDVLDRERGRGG